jgi:hypothetical protein
MCGKKFSFLISLLFGREWLSLAVFLAHVEVSNVGAIRPGTRPKNVASVASIMSFVQFVVTALSTPHLFLVVKTRVMLAQHKAKHI